jgi:hypothetical protein
MEQRPALYPNSHSEGKKILRLLWNRDFIFVLKGVLIHLNPEPHKSTPHLLIQFLTCFKIIIASTPLSPKWSHH